MPDKELLKKLGVKFDPDGEIGCQASDEVHAICDFLIGQIADSLEVAEEAERDGDSLALAAVRLQQDVLLRMAMAIHSGAHLGYLEDD